MERTSRRLAIKATHVHRSRAMKKEIGKAITTIAASCLMAASVARPSLMPPMVFQNAALILARPPRPGIADCDPGKPRLASFLCRSPVTLLSMAFVPESHRARLRRFVLGERERRLWNDSLPWAKAAIGRFYLGQIGNFPAHDLTVPRITLYPIAAWLELLNLHETSQSEGHCAVQEKPLGGNVRRRKEHAEGKGDRLREMIGRRR